MKDSSFSRCHFAQQGMIPESSQIQLNDIVFTPVNNDDAHHLANNE
jgi:hypothetical protein